MQKDATIAACKQWNDATGTEVLRPVEGNGRRIQRGRIQVNGERPRRGEVATSVSNHWHCEIAVGGLGYDPPTLVHELGHCLGLEHDDLAFSIMAEYAAPEQRLLPSHIAHVRSLMGAPAAP